MRETYFRFVIPKRHKVSRVFGFKASAKEHVSRMREVVILLEAHGVAVDVLQTDRPGYVVYEDAFQVAAEPFRGKRR